MIGKYDDLLDSRSLEWRRERGRLTAEGMNDEGMIEECSLAVVALSERAGENAAAEGTSASTERMRGVESPLSAEGGMGLMTEGGFEERLGRLGSVVALEESLGAAGRISSWREHLG